MYIILYKMLIHHIQKTISAKFVYYTKKKDTLSLSHEINKKHAGQKELVYAMCTKTYSHE